MIETKGLSILLLLLLSLCHALSWKKLLAQKIFAPALLIATTTGVPHQILAVPPPLSASALTSSLTITQVDDTPLDPRKLSKAAYREHVKLEIAGLKKLIKAEDWSAIQKEIQYYEPLFEVGALPLDDFESYSDSDIAETTRKSLTKAFKKLNEIAKGVDGLEAQPPTVQAAAKTYFMIENLYNNVARSYSGVSI
jgi:hypothetical protein